MMPSCPLTERQKSLLRSLAPSLRDGTIETTWTIFTGGDEIIGIMGLDHNGELWRNTWNGVKEADLDLFVKCGFFIRSLNGAYSLVEQDIIDSVARNFEEANLSVPTYANSPRIFISYKRADRHYTERLANHLTRIYGHETVWYDRDIYGGQRWWEEIERQIEQRDVFIYLLSREAVESVYCRAEFTEAWVKEKHIIPVQIRDLRLPNEIRGFQLVQTAHASNDVTVDALVEILASITQRPNSVPPVKEEALWTRRTIRPIEQIGLQIAVKVPANIEPSRTQLELCNTGLMLIPGDDVVITASGKISIDDRKTWMLPNGVYPDPITGTPIFFHTSEAYTAHGYPQHEAGSHGVVGSLIGWIGNDINSAFFIGEQHSFVADRRMNGFLHLAINDTKGAYADNFGEFDVTISLKNTSS
jgi:hypothetical protein